MFIQMLRRIYLIISAIGVTLLARPATSWACAVCFGGDGDPLTEGFNASVLFLMATPYLVVGSIVGGLIFHYRRTLKQREKSEALEPIAHLAWNQEDGGR
jgi:hypothetical protein